MSDRSPAPGQGGVLVAHPPRITDPESPIRTVHKGFDAFDVAFKGCMRSEDLSTLEQARLTAERENREPLVEIGPDNVAMFVASTGAKGGYRYRCDTGPFGCTLFIKRNLSLNDWNIRASVKSLPLATWGIKHVWADLKSMLGGLGISRVEESVSRADFAIDFLMPRSFSLNADQFIAHSRTSNSEISEISKFVDQFGKDIQIHLSGRVPSSVTLGKMPGRQVIVYNKRKEAIHRQKYHWFDIWDVEPDDDDASIWRIEVRAGKKHLDLFDIKSFEDLQNQFGDVAQAALSAVRYIRHRTADQNISRQPLHPMWNVARAEIASSLFDFQSGIVPEHIIKGEQGRIRDNYNSQIIGLLPGAMIANCYTVGNAIYKLPEFLRTIEKLIGNQSAHFVHKLRLAKERLHFTT